MLKELLKKFLVVIFLLLLIYPIESIMKRHEEQKEKAIAHLRSLEFHQISVFKIYPRVTKPTNTSVTFRVSDPLIEDFFQALTDISTYRPNHDTVKSRDHSWCVEVAAESDVFQIHGYIPYRKGNIVVGELAGGGSFQSRQLYKWYQKYSHRWLEPEDAPPTPTLQPETSGGE